MLPCKSVCLHVCVCARVQIFVMDVTQEANGSHAKTTPQCNVCQTIPGHKCLPLHSPFHLFLSRSVHFILPLPKSSSGRSTFFTIIFSPLFSFVFIHFSTSLNPDFFLLFLKAFLSTAYSSFAFIQNTEKLNSYLALKHCKRP